MQPLTLLCDLDRLAQQVGAPLGLVWGHLDQAGHDQARDQVFGRGAESRLVAIAALVKRAADGAGRVMVGRRGPEKVKVVGRRARKAKDLPDAVFCIRLIPCDLL